MFAESMYRKGESSRSPPAYGSPPLAVWQEMQSPARARYSPRWTWVCCAPAAIAQLQDAIASARTPAARRPIRCHGRIVMTALLIARQRRARCYGLARLAVADES